MGYSKNIFILDAANTYQSIIITKGLRIFCPKRFAVLCTDTDDYSFRYNFMIALGRYFRNCVPRVNFFVRTIDISQDSWSSSDINDNKIAQRFNMEYILRVLYHNKKIGSFCITKRINTSLQLTTLPPTYKSQNYSCSKKKTSKPNEPPVLRRLLLMIFSILFGLCLAFWGGDCLDHKRRLLGSALIGFGFLLLGGGLFLWWITFYPKTWGWPL